MWRRFPRTHPPSLLLQSYNPTCSGCQLTVARMSERRAEQLLQMALDDRAARRTHIGNAIAVWQAVVARRQALGK